MDTLDANAQRWQQSLEDNFAADNRLATLKMNFVTVEARIQVQSTPPSKAEMDVVPATAARARAAIDRWLHWHFDALL